MRPDGTVPRLRGALIADSAAAMVGAAARHLDDDELHRERGRRESRRPHRSYRGYGRRSVPAGVVFRAAGRHVPAYATAPALLYVACLMTRGLAEVDWKDSPNTRRP